ncbi:hypothetical protein FQZ97_979940 [compost metagenome]
MIKRFIDVITRRVVMTRQNDSAMSRQIGYRATMFGRIGVRIRHALLTMHPELLIRELHLAHVISAIRIKINELTLSRCMIHQRSEFNAVIACKKLECLKAIC